MDGAGAGTRVGGGADTGGGVEGRGADTGGGVDGRGGAATAKTCKWMEGNAGSRLTTRASYQSMQASRAKAGVEHRHSLRMIDSAEHDLQVAVSSLLYVR